MKKKVAILGATGIVGYNFVKILDKHPFFEISELCASKRSKGKKYKDALKGEIDTNISYKTRNMIVKECTPNLDAQYLFSALSPDIAGKIEKDYAEKGYIVFSNAKSHRMKKNVPLIIPEVNWNHISMIDNQKTKGKIITNPNCSTIGLALGIHPIDKYFEIERITVVTLQAVSGAGYSGVSHLQINDNVIPHIEGEENKIINETNKILGNLNFNNEINKRKIKIDVHCNRVPVSNGHSESVFVKFKSNYSFSKIKKIWNNFKPEKRYLDLPSGIKQPIIYFDKNNYPQPKLHRNLAGGMCISIGNLKKSVNFHCQFVLLVHNTVRGAAGSSVLNAEYYYRDFG